MTQQIVNSEQLQIVNGVSNQYLRQFPKIDLSFLRRQESIFLLHEWIPACAGMTSENFAKIYFGEGIE